MIREDIKKRLEELINIAEVLFRKLKKNVDAKLSREYDAWYTESLEFVSLLLPKRKDEFYGCYKSHIRQYLYDNGPSISFNDYEDSPEIFLDNQFNILCSCYAMFDVSFVDIRSLISSDIYETELASADALRKAKYYRSAGCICGVLLEKHLSNMCDNHSVKISKKKPTLADFYQELRSNNIITVQQLKELEYYASIRNLCDHKSAKEPTDADIETLIKGTEKVMKTYI